MKIYDIAIVSVQITMVVILRALNNSTKPCPKGYLAGSFSVFACSYLFSLLKI